MWKPDRSNGSPLYMQIADFLGRRIAYGEFPPGSLLPSERKLADQLSVNRSTIVQAFDELRSSGLVESAAGSGTFVSRQLPAHAGRATNWRQVSESGSFMPNLPAMRRIRSELRSHASLIDLASGELGEDLFPTLTIRKLLQEKPFTARLGYEDPQGYAPLRSAIIDFLKRYLGIHAMESSILVTSGSQQSLFLITQCLLGQGDAVAMEEPSYTLSLPMFRSAGLRVFPLPVDESAGGIDPAAIEELHRRHRLRMVFLNPSFQNPTGCVMGLECRQRVLDICARLGIPIVEDDPFSLTAFDAKPVPSLKSLDTHGQVMYIGSLSKIAASGLRIGWLVAPQSVIDRLADARQQMDFGLSPIPQWVASELLGSEEFDHHLTGLRSSLSERLDKMMECLRAELSGRLHVAPPAGGLNIWAKLAEEQDEMKLLDRAIARGVVYVPGSVYGSEPSRIRLSFAKPAVDEIESGVRRLAEAIKGR